MKIVEGIYRKDGHCPCRLQVDDTTLCPCNQFVNEGICKCNLFVSINDHKIVENDVK